MVVPRVNTPAGAATNAAATGTTTGFTPVPESFDLSDIYYTKFGETVDCVDQAPDGCTVVRGDDPHVMLMGDSNAEMWIPAFKAMARSEGVTLSLAIAAGCLWQRDAYKLNDDIVARCRRTKTDAYEQVIPALDPDLIVLINAREPKGPVGAAYTDSPFDQTLRRSTRESLDELGKGRQLLIVEPAPTPTDPAINPLDCLDEADVVEQCRFVASTGTNWLLEEERTLATASDSIATADFSHLICPFFPICDPIVDDKVVFWNGRHITSEYSRTLGDDVGRYLKEQGLIPS